MRYAVGIALCVPLLWLGAVNDHGLLAAVVCSIGLMAFAMRMRTRSPSSRSVRAGSIALWGAVGWYAFQLIPMPHGMLARLSPRAASLWADSERLFEYGPTWHPISVDPPSTAIALATAFAAALTYQAVVRLSSDKEARARVLQAIVVAVLVIDLLALAHQLAGLDTVYGFYEPHNAGARQFISPLLNANHAAAVACIAPPLLLGLAADAPVSGRIMAGIGVVVSGAIAVLSLSRGGMLVLGLELAVMALYFLMQRGSLTERSTRALGSLLVIGGVVGAIALAGTQHVMREASDTDVSKLKIPLQALTLVREFPVTGIGRGAFAPAFAGYTWPLPTGVVYTHPENWPAQLVVEMGVPIALAYVGLLGWAVIGSRRALSRPLYVGATVALGGLVVHDLFDFAMEFAGVGMLAAALLAVVTTTGARRDAVESDRVGTASLLAAGGGTVVAVLLAAWGHRPLDEEAALHERSKHQSLESLARDIEAAARRHPADPYFYALEGMRNVRRASGGTFLAHSVKLGPARGMTHVWLARWFVVIGNRPQAWAEYRQALALEPWLMPRVISDLVRFDADLDELELLVTSPGNADLVAQQLDRNDRRADAESIDLLAISRFPPAVSARIRQINRARENEDLDRARALVQDLLKVAANEPQAYLFAAAFGKPADAEDMLEKGLAACGPSNLALLEELVRRRGTRLGLAAIPDELHRLQQAFDASGAPPSRMHVLEAKIEIARDQPNAAIRHYLDAAASSPEDLQLVETAATLAGKTGQIALAQSLWARLLAARPGEVRYQRALDALRTKTIAPDGSTVP